MARTSRRPDRGRTCCVDPDVRGVEDVRLLDGGYDRWVQAGHPLETIRGRPPRLQRSGPDPRSSGRHRRHRRGQADRERRGPAALVSVRTWREHIGEVSGYDYIQPAGRIAGDVWGNCGSDAYHMQHYRNVDNTMRAYRRSPGTGPTPASRPTSGRLLLRDGLAGERDLVLRASHGLVASCGLRRRLARVEQRSGEQHGRGRSSDRRARRLTQASTIAR